MDANLVERARGGDSSAQEELVRRLMPRLFRLAVRLECDVTRAEELVGDALYHGLVRLRDLRQSAAAPAWFARILINRWRDRLRRRKRRDMSLEELPREPVAPESLAPEGRTRAAELRERLERALACMPPGQRAVLTLRIDEGFSVAEIARVLDTTPERVKANLWHGRKRLRRLLGDFLGREPLAEEM